MVTHTEDKSAVSGIIGALGGGLTALIGAVAAGVRGWVPDPQVAAVTVGILSFACGLGYLAQRFRHISEA